MRYGLALVVCLLAMLMALAAWEARRASDARDSFYTKEAREEPTRADIPYTGTVPRGLWGALPWGEAAAPSPGPGRPAAWFAEGSGPRCYGSLSDALDGPRLARVCRRCGGGRNFHDSIQSLQPHGFAPGALRELGPADAGPHLEGGFPAIN